MRRTRRKAWTPRRTTGSTSRPPRPFYFSSALHSVCGARGGTVGADALRMRFANGRAAIEWTSSFAPAYGHPLVNNHGEVGVPQWHKRDPVTQTKFRSEMMRKNSGWYHNPAEDKPVGVPCQKRHLPGIELNQPLGLPDETMRALVVHKQYERLKKTRCAYSRTLERSFAATQNDLDGLGVRRFRPSIFYTKPIPKALPTLRRGYSTVSTVPQMSRRTSTVPTPAKTSKVDYLPWTPPSLPGVLRTKNRAVAEVRSRAATPLE